MIKRWYKVFIMVIMISLITLSACKETASDVSEAEIDNSKSAIKEPDQSPAQETSPIEEPISTGDSDSTGETPNNENENDRESNTETLGDAQLVWLFEYDHVDFAARSLVMHPDGALVTVGAYIATYTHRLYDGELTAVDTDYRHSVDQIDISPSGRYLATGLSAFGVMVKDLEGETADVQLHGGYNNYVKFTNHDSQLVTGNRSGDIWFWSIPEGEQIKALSDGEQAYLWGLAYHPSGEQVASIQWRDEGVLNIWSIEDDALIHSLVLNILVGSTRNVIAYSPNGDYLVAYFKEDWDHVIKILDTVNYELLVEIPLEKRVLQIAFSPDSQMIGVASDHAPISIFSVETGEELYTFNQDVGTSNGSVGLSFTPDGGHVGVVRKDGNLELWRLPGADAIEEPDIDIYQPVPIPGDVLFDTASYELKPDADVVLENLALTLLNQLPEAHLTFVGHTDSRGDAETNRKLSLDRATSVQQWFVKWAENNKVSGWTFAVDGMGAVQLKIPDIDGEGNFREEAGSVNRRVEIEIKTP